VHLVGFYYRTYQNARSSECHILRQLLSSTAISIVVKIKICRAKVKLVAVYGSETWSLNETDTNRPGT